MDKFVVLILLLAPSMLINVSAQERSTDACAELKEPTNRLISKECLYENARHFLNSANRANLPVSFGENSLESEHKLLLERSCQPVAFYLLGRHAARYPREEEIRQFNSKLLKLTYELINQYGGDSQLANECLGKFEPFMSWVPRIKPEQEMLITQQGAEEERNIARRYKALFPKFFNTKTSAIQFGVTKRIRTAQTAAEFMMEVDGFQSPGCNEQLPLHDILSEEFDLKKTYDNVCYNELMKVNAIDILMAHKICRKLSGKKKGPKDPTVQRLKESNLLKSIGQKIANKLALNDSSVMDGKMVESIFKMCAHESAFMNGSVWCRLLDDNDIEALEYSSDVKTYLSDTYGPNARRGQTCVVTQDIVNNFEDVVKSDGANAKSFFYISHDSLLKRFLADLGLFKDDEGMSMESIQRFIDHHELPKSRQWRASLLTPFSSNVAFILYRCQGDPESKPEYEIMTALNERPVKLGGCNAVHCDRMTFLDAYRKSYGCNYQQICGLDPVQPPFEAHEPKPKSNNNNSTGGFSKLLHKTGSCFGFGCPKTLD